jgi:hypothetical protein
MPFFVEAPADELLDLVFVGEVLLEDVLFDFGKGLILDL